MLAREVFADTRVKASRPIAQQVAAGTEADRPHILCFLSNSPFSDALKQEYFTLNDLSFII